MLFTCFALQQELNQIRNVYCLISHLVLAIIKPKQFFIYQLKTHSYSLRFAVPWLHPCTNLPSSCICSLFKESIPKPTAMPTSQGLLQNHQWVSNPIPLHTVHSSSPHLCQHLPLQGLPTVTTEGCWLTALHLVTLGNFAAFLFQVAQIRQNPAWKTPVRVLLENTAHTYRGLVNSPLRLDA